MKAHCWILVPSPIAPPERSRTSPLVRLVIEKYPPPTELICHCWLALPGPRVHCCMTLPLAVEPLALSRARPLLTSTMLNQPPPASRKVHCWSGSPLSVHCTIWAPFAVEAPLTPNGLPVSRL